MLVHYSTACINNTDINNSINFYLHKYYFNSGVYALTICILKALIILL